MTDRDRAKEATWDTGAGDWATVERERLESKVEAAIKAAVEEDRKTRPHEFVGRTDRWCEVCNEPDRDARHLFSRENMKNSIEFEREACAKIADEMLDEHWWGDSIGEAIRERCNKSATESNSR
jgi:hypothetical protein